VFRGPVLPCLRFCGRRASPEAIAASAAARPLQTSLRQLQIANKPWLGDFDKLLTKRRMLRVYAPFSRSLYFSDKGRERGLAVELVRDWERVPQHQVRRKSSASGR
jgi:hypothetical protein